MTDRIRISTAINSADITATILNLAQYTVETADRCTDVLNDLLTENAALHEGEVAEIKNQLALRYDILEAALTVASLREDLIQGFVPQIRAENYERTIRKMVTFVEDLVKDHISNDRPVYPANENK